jgi:4-hydroxybutyrate CoA-transferase
MGMWLAQFADGSNVAMNSPREIRGNGAAPLILRCTKARLYYPRLMSRPFEKATLADAVGRLRPGMKVLLPAGCGDPTALVAEILLQSDRLAPLTLMGGLRRLADAHQRGDVDFVPLRYFDTVSVFAAGGAWAPDAVIVHCSPPDRAGYLSLGVSMSYLLSAARRAPCVIAQVNPRMPRTLGNAFLHRSQIDCWAEAEHALVEYPPTPVGEIEQTIARHVAELVPDGATVQVGVGSIPQAVMEALAGKRDLGIHSLLVDHMLPLIEAGVITNSRKRLHRGRMDVGEIMGTERLFRWVHDNPMVNMEPSDIVHDPQVVGALGDFVSVNSALEVDLLGQVNAESVDGRQITGIGGQFDFVLGASRATGGRSVIALPSTGRQGKVSRIAARLPSGARVTTPRFIADCVVTEYGTAALRGQSDAGRARALARIAHPAFREALEREAATS